MITRSDLLYPIMKLTNAMIQSLNTFARSIDNEIENKLGDKSSSRHNKIMNTGWSRVPNCADITVDAGIIDKKLVKVGLKVMENQKVRVTIKPFRNKGINRYMIFQLKRLKAARNRNDGKLF